MDRRELTDSNKTMAKRKPRQVKADSHRGKVAQVLLENGWMNCHGVAEITEYTTDSASRVLSEIHRAEYAEHRPVKEKDGPQYEYILKDSIEFVE